MFKLLVLIFITANVFAGNLNKYYQEGLAAAHANMHKPKEQVENYKPEEKFTNYSDQPPQMSYYHGVKGYKTEELQTAGAAAAVYNDQDEQNNAVQTAKKSLQTNPKEKINAADPWLSRSGKIMSNAADLALGVSSKNNEGVKHDTKAGVNCQEAKACRVDLVKKTCNEAKTVYKICESVPEISTHINNVIHHGCQKITVTQATWNHCPAGYQQILYSDMIRFESWDDIRICQTAARQDEQAECFAGYLVRGINGGSTLLQSTQRMVLPKKMHGRIRFTNFFNQHMIVTVVNETTGQALCNAESITNGRVIELPFSTTQDQVFRFNDHAINFAGFGRFGGGSFLGKGVMILYIDHINSERVATVNWKDLPCHYE